MRIVADLRAVLQNWVPKSQILRVQFALAKTQRNPARDFEPIPTSGGNQRTGFTL